MGCDSHPLKNLRVFKYLEEELGVDQKAKLAWICTWLENGLAAVEQLVLNVGHSESYCLGETPGIADLCVIPQLYNARRIDYDPSLCPTLVEIDSLLADHPAFQAAHPANQPDSEPEIAFRVAKRRGTVQSPRHRDRFQPENHLRQPT